jgi:hypothetical protein
MSVAPSEQLRKYLRDEAAGLQTLRFKFLWQMEHEAFGSALQKLRYLRQCYTACGEDVHEASKWLLNHGPSMLTPSLEPLVVQLCIRFPEVESTEMLTLLRVCDESAGRVKEVLRSREGGLTYYERVQMRVARKQLDARICVVFRDELPPKVNNLYFSERAAMLRSSFTRRSLLSDDNSFSRRRMREDELQPTRDGSARFGARCSSDSVLPGARCSTADARCSSADSALPASRLSAASPRADASAQDGALAAACGPSLSAEARRRSSSFCGAMRLSPLAAGAPVAPTAAGPGAPAAPARVLSAGASPLGRGGCATGPRRRRGGRGKRWWREGGETQEGADCV